MQLVTFRPETESDSTERAVAADRTNRSLSHADRILLIAVIVPLTFMALLTLIGFGIVGAVCITMVLVFTITTTIDITCLIRRHRSQS